MLTRIADDLFELPADNAGDARALADSLRESRHWIEVVPGLRSVAVRYDAAAQPAAEVEQAIRAAVASEPPVVAASNEVLQIPVVYGGDHGPDLTEVCRRLNVTEQDFVDYHTSRDFPVEILGFTPGFAFIGGLAKEWQLPRRPSPRQHVPAGTIAIAGARTGIYTVASPGGWNLVGRTTLRLFRPEDDDPFVVRAGMCVQFVPVDAGQARV